MNKLFYVTGTALLLLSTLAAAETYRSVDKDGNVQFSDRPSRGAEQVKVQVPGQEPAAPPANTNTATDNADKTAAPTAADETSQVRAEKCEQAKQRLTTYETADTLYEAGEGDSKRMLSTDEQVDAIVKARHLVKEFCGSPAV